MTTLARLDIPIGADTRSLDTDLARAEKSVEDFGASVSNVGGKLTAAFTAPILGAGAGAILAAGHAAAFADKINDLSQSTGLSTKELQTWKFITDATGGSLDDVTKAATVLTAKLNATGAESKTFTAALNALGVDAKDSTGHVREMSDLLPEIIGKLQTTQGVTERNALAADLFGKSYTALAPLLGMTSGELNKLREQADKVGVVMGQDALDAADSYGQQVNVLKASLVGVTNQLGTAFLPILSELATFAQDNVIPAISKIATWVGEATKMFAGLSPELKIAVGVTVALAAAVGPVLLALGGLLAILPEITAAVAIFGGATGLLLIPIAIGAVTAAGVALVRHWGDLKEALAAWVEVAGAKIRGLVMFFETMKTDVVKFVADMWEQVTGFFSTKLAAIGDMVKKGIDAVVAPFKWMYDVVVGHSIVPDMWRDVLKHFDSGTQGMAESVKKGGTFTVTAFDAMADKLGTSAGGIANVIGFALKPAFDAVDGALKSVGNAITSVFGAGGAAVASFAGGILGNVVGDLLGGLATSIFDAGSALTEAVANWRQHMDDFQQSLDDWVWSTGHHTPQENIDHDTQNRISGAWNASFGEGMFGGVGAVSEWIKLKPLLHGDFSDIDVLRNALASGHFDAIREQIEAYLKALQTIFEGFTNQNNDLPKPDKSKPPATNYGGVTGTAGIRASGTDWAYSGANAGAAGITINFNGDINAGFGARPEQVVSALLYEIEIQLGQSLLSWQHATGNLFVR